MKLKGELNVDYIMNLQRLDGSNYANSILNCKALYDTDRDRDVQTDTHIYYSTLSQNILQLSCGQIL